MHLLYPASILCKSIAGRYRPVRVADRPITARHKFIKNAYWVITCSLNFVENIFEFLLFFILKIL